MIVVDANVSIKWVLNDEDYVTEAAALRDAVLADTEEFVAPRVWLHEVLNRLVIAARRGRITVDAGQRLLSDILAVPVESMDAPALDVYRTAFRYNSSGHDAAYVALASQLQVELWTGDHRLYQAMRNTNIVRWIGDYK